jgi:cytoskeletal protein RodZ
MATLKLPDLQAQFARRRVERQSVNQPPTSEASASVPKTSATEADNASPVINPQQENQPAQVATSEQVTPVAAPSQSEVIDVEEPNVVPEVTPAPADRDPSGVVAETTINQEKIVTLVDFRPGARVRVAKADGRGGEVRIGETFDSTIFANDDRLILNSGLRTSRIVERHLEGNTLVLQTRSGSRYEVNLVAN